MPEKSLSVDAGNFGVKAPKDLTPPNAFRLPLGWHLTPEGAWVRDCKSRMTRRKRDWDYKAPCIYLITLVLRDRKSKAFGHIIGKQVMPDHFHGLIWVQEPLPCHLGQIINGFISGCRRHGAHFSTGYNDKPLMGRGQLSAEMRYLRENPLRLAIKLSRPDLFKVRRDIVIKGLCFEVIGNNYLLQRPMHQVQCSRRFFAYQRQNGQIVRDSQGAPQETMRTAEFDVLREAMEAAAELGAVIISPCISEGERELARLAHEAGYPVVALRNMGFPEIYKPGGKAFERCAEGKLLLMAPIQWPYQNIPRAMTREDACVLNRIAQLLSGEGAAEIDYKGLSPAQIDRLVVEATRRPND